MEGVRTCSRTCSMLNRIVGCKTGSILWLINTPRDIQYRIQSYPVLYVYNVHESSTREEKSEPSHYTGKVRAHANVLACLTLYSPPCPCVQTTSKLTESARRVHPHSNKCHVRSLQCALCAHTYAYIPIYNSTYTRALR